MLDKRWYEWMLLVAYVILAAICGLLSYGASMSTLAVNGAMFLIIGIVFLLAENKCMKPMNEVMEDMAAASRKIVDDADKTDEYLWDEYVENEEELFESVKMQELYQNFTIEVSRADENTYCKADIGEYINDELIDEIMHKSELNQVPGIMTGLGILGTFIGLSLGLQHFNTGSANDMVASIKPLMDGIKVAFHTSIFGMVFSLVFNAVYRKKCYEAETAIKKFVSCFRKYVLPDSSLSGLNRLIELSEMECLNIDKLHKIAKRPTDEAAAEKLEQAMQAPAQKEAPKEKVLKKTLPDGRVLVKRVPIEDNAEA